MGVISFPFKIGRTFLGKSINLLKHQLTNMKKIFFPGILAMYALCSCNSPGQKPNATDAAHKDSVVAIAKEAFVYALPLALMDITKKKLTNYEVPSNGTGAPINQFSISTKFPDAKF